MKRVFVTIFMLVGLSGFLVSGFATSYERSVKAWPQYPAVVERSEIFTGRSPEGGVRYSADVAYTYEVAGRQYRSLQFGIGSFSTSSRATIREMLAPFPEGAEVMAYVNPDDAGDAVLAPDTDLFFWVGAVIGGVFAAIAVLMWLLVPAELFVWRGVRWTTHRWDHE
ncbi:DUF3592 domain-containing protein [Shimia sp. MIT1388]|uniref:DUF3592 domain-containing protein n=1 Tax=Shimia sp. MIT1388 TaxID=3096992 RepID=UPI00399B7019